MGLGYDLLCDIAAHRLVLLEATGCHRHPGASDGDQPLTTIVGLETSDDLDLGAEGIRDRLAILLRGEAPHRDVSSRRFRRVANATGERQQHGDDAE